MVRGGSVPGRAVTAILLLLLLAAAVDKEEGPAPGGLPGPGFFSVRVAANVLAFVYCRSV